MMTQSRKNIITIIIASVLVIGGLVAYILILQGKNAELELQNGAFNLKIEELQGEITLHKAVEEEIRLEIDQLEIEKQELLNIKTQTDREVITTTNIRLLDANASWSRIDSAIKLALTDTVYDN